MRTYNQLIELLEMGLNNHAKSIEKEYEIMRKYRYRVSIEVEREGEYETELTYKLSKDGSVLTGDFYRKHKYENREKNLVKVYRGGDTIQVILCNVNTKSENLNKTIGKLCKIVERTFKFLNNPRNISNLGDKDTREKGLNEIYNPAVMGSYIYEWDGTVWKGKPNFKKREIQQHDFNYGRFDRGVYNVKITRVVTVTHKLTNHSYTLTDDNKRSGYDISEQAIANCARMVESKFKAPMLVSIRDIIPSRYQIECIHASLYATSQILKPIIPKVETPRVNFLFTFGSRV